MTFASFQAHFQTRPLIRSQAAIQLEENPQVMRTESLAAGFQAIFFLVLQFPGNDHFIYTEIIFPRYLAITESHVTKCNGSTRLWAIRIRSNGS